MRLVTHKRHLQGSALLMAILAVAMIPAGSANAIVKTNSVPYANDFEAAGTIIHTNALGWSGVDTNYAYTVVTSYTATAGWPISGAHTAVAQLDTQGDTITNILSGSSNTDTNYWIDMNIRMVSSDAEPSAVTNDSEVQVAIYLSSSSNLVAYHAMPDDPAVFDTASTNYFTTLSHAAIENESWHRLTVQMDYKTTGDPLGYGLDHDWFRILLDGVAISNATMAWDITDLEAGPGGEWFLCANSNIGTNRTLNATLLSGTGYFDDFVATNGEPTYAVTTYYTNGVPSYWLTGFSLELNNSASGALYNVDNDVHPAWAEWLLGTDPTISNDFLLTVESNGGTNTVKWVADGMMDSSAPDIMIKKSTNLLESYSSTQTHDRSTMSVGTNMWEDTTGGDAMYRLGVNSN